MSVEPKKYTEKFSKLAEKAGFTKELLVEVEGYPIYGYKKYSDADQTIYLSSGVHGDEPSGPLALLSLLEEDVFDSRANWLLFPMLNPVGLSAGSRENGQGIDLNRDYLQRESEEIKAHVKWLEENPIPDLVLSLHEDWESTGFYLYEININASPSFSQAILAKTSEIIPVEPEPMIDDHLVRKAGWIYHEADADLPNSWPEAIYLAKRGAGVSYTLETPSSLQLEKRIMCHKVAVLEALGRE